MVRTKRIELLDATTQLSPKIRAFRSMPLFMAYSQNPEAPQIHLHDQGWRFGLELFTLEAYRDALYEGKLPMAIRAKAQMIQTHFEKILLEELANRQLLKKRTIIFREEGDELDIDRLYGGQPEHWRTPKPTLRPKQFVKIAICGLQDFNKTDLDFIRMGTLACCLSGVLSRLGFSVEILVSLVGRVPKSRALQSSAKTNDERWDLAGLVFPLKSATEIADLNRIMAVRFPGLIRHDGFRALMQMGIKPHQVQTPKTAQEITRVCTLLNLDLYVPEDMPDLDDLVKSKPFYAKLTDQVITSVWGPKS